MDKTLKYKCDKCQKTFAEKNQYGGHRSKCGKMNFKCSICDRKFRNQKGLGLHMSKHKCEVCNKVFPKPEYKVSHMKNVHGKNEYLCKYVKMFLHLNQHCNFISEETILRRKRCQHVTFVVNHFPIILY